MISLSWSEPHIGCGNFELELPLTDEFLPLVNSFGWYVEKDSSDFTMIVNKIDISEKPTEDANTITLSGESLESILKRRIIWGTITTTGSLKTRINRLLQYNVTCENVLNGDSRYGYNAYQAKRKIDNFIIASYTDGNTIFPKLSDDTTDVDPSTNNYRAQNTGENLYDVINTLCSDVGVSFRIKRDGSNFVFYLKECRDNRKVMIIGDFSNDYVSLETFEDNSNYANVAMIGGVNEWPKRCYAYAGSVNSAGMSRYEIFVDARNEETDSFYRAVSSPSSSKLNDYYEKQSDDSFEKTEDTTVKSGKTYYTKLENATLSGSYKTTLQSKGKNKLKEYKMIHNLSGTFSSLFKKRIENGEIELGDIVTVFSSSLTKTYPAKLIELSYGWDSEGLKLTPTFEYYEE